MHEPRLVILDEPTAGVDFELRLELWRYIRRLHGEGHDDPPHHALPRGGRGAVRGHRADPRRPGDRARHRGRAARELRRRLARRRLRQGDGQLTTAVHARGRPAAVGMVLAAAASLQVGAAFAVTLFDDLGPARRGVPAARARRDRAVDRLAPRRSTATCGWRALFGVALGCMNWSIYESMDRHPARRRGDDRVRRAAARRRDRARGGRSTGSGSSWRRRGSCCSPTRAAARWTRSASSSR